MVRNGEGRGHSHSQTGRGGIGHGGTGRGGGSSRGRGSGRGRGLTAEDISEISAAKRITSVQITSEATDDLLVAPALDSNAQNFARFVLSKENFDGFRTQRQARDFVHSLLVNLSNHHDADTSGLLTNLASENGRARLREIIGRRMVINAGQERTLTSFQYVIMPLVGVLTRENVCQSTLVSHTGRIYAEIYNHRLELLDQGIIPCMRELIDQGMMRDSSLHGDELLRSKSLMQVPSLQHAMLAIVRLVYHLIKRVQGAKKDMIDTVNSICILATDCVQRSDGSSMSRFLNLNLEKECQRLRSMVSDPAPSVIAPASVPEQHQRSREPNLVQLILNFDPPGHLSEDGPRHDNDHASIEDIKVVPTQDELTCQRWPFLPSNDVPGAPHHLQPGWPQLLDIHFRLNREDMIDQLRRGIMSFIEALQKVTPNRQASLLERKELRRLLGGADVALYAYGNIQFLGTNTERRLQGSIKIAFDQPPQLKGQNTKQRTTFWERSKRRLMQGSLVCFIFPADEGGLDTGHEGPAKVHLSLGVVSVREASELAKDAKKAAVNITLTSHDELHRFVTASTKGQQDIFMVESMGGFFEAYRPILRALQTCHPGDMPFGKYLAPAAEQKTEVDVAVVDPPMYATAPDFRFDLTILLNRPAEFHLDVQDPTSREQAVAAIRAHSIIDDTQSQALVDALSREVALISGPPGTGKTKIGVDLMRVLLHNAKNMNCGPILCICFTNHALDQFLEHLLDQGITHLVRIGSRSQSQKLQKYALGELMKAQPKQYAVRSAMAQAYGAWEEAVKTLESIEKKVRRSEPLEQDILDFLRMENDIQYEELEYPDLENRLRHDPVSVAKSYERWSTAADIEEMEKENRKSRKNWNKTLERAAERRDSVLEKADEEGMEEWEIENELADLEVLSKPPVLHTIPTTNRPLLILRTAGLWMMSRPERTQLKEYWAACVQEEFFKRHAEIMETIRSLSKQVDDAHDEIRRVILRKAQVIGMTTNGAAKFQSIIEALSPQIIVCEEAGEVLESHILAALSGSTRHLILIGDHLQLRPQIATYELSSDSDQGKYFNLDRSLFERLVTTAKVPSSLLTTQRRMRPEICNLVRHTLYKSLIDGRQVLDYPDVFGMASNLFFMDHRQSEDNRDQYGIQSYANTFEAEMVHGLVRHLIKNGHHQSSIAVLTPYLGQLSRLRDKLSDIFRLAIDERDQEQLDALDDNDPTVDVSAKAVASSRSLTLRTIDNYQGEEADIVIISLVRSSKIGFLKSPNRTNVLLSRARHGMYLIGHASLMGHVKETDTDRIWPPIMKELDETGRIGEGFPLRCRNHPEIETMVCTPDDFKIYAPNGGCTQACDQVLLCGHICTMLCHWDDRDHQRFKCTQPCPRLHSDCNHVCHKQCNQDCGDCTELVGALSLLCGHVLASSFCFQAKDPSRVRCKERVVRQLPHCEHDHTMDCYKDPAAHKCMKKCDAVRDCAHICSRPCHQCQTDSLTAKGLKDSPPPGKIERTPAVRHVLGNALIKVAASYRVVLPVRACHVTNAATRLLDPNVMEMVVDMIMQAPLSDIDVNEDPILVMSCGHALTMSTLDHLMEMTNYYEGDINLNTGAIAFVKTKELPTQEVAIMTCPSCRAPITGLLRYGRRIKHSQLVMRLKKFEISQSVDIKSAEDKFSAAQITVTKTLPAFLKKMPAAPKSAGSESSTSKSNNSPRRLGQFASKEAMFPNSDVSSLVHSYDIRLPQEKAWKELIKPALGALQAFDQIRGNAKVSPGRRLYEASVSHLYRFKSQVFYVDSVENGATTVLWTPEQSQQIMDDCARECGLSPDGNTGSSLVRSVQGRTNVLLLVLHAARKALDDKNSGGISSGWYLFVEDLIQCCIVHAGIQRDVAKKGNYPRIEMYANMHLLDVYLKQMQWLGRRPFDMNDPEQKQARQKVADAILEPFMDTAQLIHNSDQVGLRQECMSKALDLESHMVTAYKVALQQLNQPLTKEEKFQVFHAVQASLAGSGHWYRCPNGHTYVIADCGQAMQESRCPECGARIGGGNHTLLSDNQRDSEFEGMHVGLY
ncbi:hypothetical protein DFQ26_004686 [Actinomortierella ambigua]|nr:hypothetical protein DFQ26_004686 [Actinomortierella ambigua]